LALLSCAATLSAQTLMWNANTESDIGGYIVQYGTQSGNPSTSIDVGNVTSRTITGLTAGTTYYFQVVAYNSSGQQSTPSTQVTYTAPAVPSGPTITTISPTSGPTAGGTVITIAGTNFAAGATVRVGGVGTANVTVASSTQIIAATPPGTAGAQSVQVTSGGVTATSPVNFTYTSTSTLTPAPKSISPRSGPTTGGTLITVTGSKFEAGATIKIGGKPATSVTFVSSTTLTARTPAMPVGGYPVQVFNPNGKWGNTSRGFLYVAGSTSVEVLTAAESVESLAASTGEMAADTTAASRPASETTFRRYLAEGVENAQMQTVLALANPQQDDAHATLTFETAAGAQTQLSVDVPARSRRTVDLSTVPELAGASFSTLLESDRELALDRLISFGAQGSAASLESAVDQPSTRWYFAEGSTVDPQELFYLVQNPGVTEARVRIRYLLPNGGTPVVRTTVVAPGSRATIWVDRENPALASTDVAAEITSVNGTPIVVERSSYVRQAGSTALRGGDTSGGVTAPATRWFVDGATGQYTTRLLLANPGPEAAAVRATYQRADGRSLTRSYTLAPNSRQSVDVASVHPSLTNTTLGITVEASAPIAMAIRLPGSILITATSVSESPPTRLAGTLRPSASVTVISSARSMT
jgi:hypothetical protein